MDLLVHRCESLTNVFHCFPWNVWDTDTKVIIYFRPSHIPLFPFKKLAVGISLERHFYACVCMPCTAVHTHTHNHGTKYLLLPQKPQAWKYREGAKPCHSAEGSCFGPGISQVAHVPSDATAVKPSLLVNQEQARHTARLSCSAHMKPSLSGQPQKP